jgi:hypothetical protein
LLKLRLNVQAVILLKLAVAIFLPLTTLLRAPNNAWPNKIEKGEHRTNCMYQSLQHHLAVMVLFLSAADFLELGLHFAGFEQHRNQRTCMPTNLRRFRAHFGVSPEALSAIFTDLQTTTIVAARIDKPDPDHFLMALNWLRSYKVEEQLAGSCKVTEKTARKWIWKYTGAIQALKAAKVSSNNN